MATTDDHTPLYVQKVDQQKPLPIRTMKIFGLAHLYLGIVCIVLNIGQLIIVDFNEEHDYEEVVGVLKIMPIFLSVWVNSYSYYHITV